MARSILTAFLLGSSLLCATAAADSYQRPISGTIRAVDISDRTFLLGPIEVYVPIGSGNLAELQEGQAAIVYFRGHPASSRVTALKIEQIPSMD